MAAAVTTSEPLHFVLNGRPVPIDAQSTSTTLLDFLRTQGLTGAKEGCAEGECGACTVALIGNDGGGSAYRAVNSCLILLPTIADHEVYTVEALASGAEATDVQRRLAEAGASQCGYCTPGFVMSLFAEQYRPDRDGPCDPLALSGNLCRCTGYRPIRDAVLAVGPAPEGPFRERLAHPAPRLSPIDQRRFSRPSTIADAVSKLSADQDATLVAGGSDIAVDSNLRGWRSAHLISLDGIRELRECVETPSMVRIGAALPLADIGRRWQNAPAVFHEWLELFASLPIRNRATLGGNLATASPIGDAAPLLAALDAEVEVAGVAGRRRIPVSSFFAAYRRTALQRDEIITAVEIPKPLPACVRFYKVSKRRLSDISTVAAAMALDLEHSGRVRRARFVFGGMAATPIRLIDAEDVINDQSWDEAAMARVQDVVVRSLTPISDHRGSSRYRLEVARSLVEKFWWESRA
jgi:xanthine dehydrogenase small subunit